MRYLVGGCVAIVAFAIGFFETLPARELAARERQFESPIRPGDLVFQDLDCGERCALIRRITGSRYTHVGIVLDEDGERMVWEAFGPVGPTPLEDWVGRGIDRSIAVYRPRAELATRQERLAAAVRVFRDRPYDADYQWDDERIYCSELVAKAYRAALGHEVFVPRPVELGVDEARIAALSHGRFGRATRLVSPADLVRSGDFERIVDELEPHPPLAGR